jgi:SPP1 family predicted phage head-tail adaptor
MQAGKLRHQLTIEQPDSTEGSAGEALPVYSTFATVWGSIEPLSGSEGLQGRQAGSEVTHRVRIRYHAGITSNMRIVWNGRYLQPVTAAYQFRRTQPRNRIDVPGSHHTLNAPRDIKHKAARIRESPSTQRRSAKARLFPRSPTW